MTVAGDSDHSMRCNAQTRSGQPCKNPKITDRPRCRMHGCAPGAGAPSGERNGRFVDGHYTRQARAERLWARQLLLTFAKGKLP